MYHGSMSMPYEMHFHICSVNSKESKVKKFKKANDTGGPVFPQTFYTERGIKIKPAPKAGLINLLRILNVKKAMLQLLPFPRKTRWVHRYKLDSCPHKYC